MFPARIRIGIPPDALGSRLDWLHEYGANGWAMKKAALDQQASDAARRLFPSESLDLGDVRTKPILIMGTRASTNRPSNSPWLSLFRR